MSTLATEISIHGARLSRRGFLGTGGALVVALSLSPALARAAAAAGRSLDPGQLSSWIELNADGSVLIRTGKCDFGQSSIYTAYRQIVAEELYLPVEAVTTVVTGDTDTTPDGGGTFALLVEGVVNLRKVAAYVREAALTLAAERLATPRERIALANGTFSGGDKALTYAELVAGQDLELTIPVSGELTGFIGLSVTGDPPLKPVASYSVIGQPVKNPIHRPKMSGETLWVNDVKLPGMLHARAIHPATLGSTLLAAGELDQARFPGAQVVKVGNLLAVVSESEWEAVQAARTVAAKTKWSDWKGLPGHDKLFAHLRDEVDWGEVPGAKGTEAGDAAAAAAAASKTHAGTYFMPYFKHAPISPTVSLADVRPDGSVTLHTHSQNPQFLRMAIAMMLGEPESKVVIRTYPGASHFGRSNGGNAGSEDEAVLLSRALGKPVRVQWMREDDMRWSTQSSTSFSRISIGLGEDGRIVSYQADHSGPPMQDDRPIGAILAGLPTIGAPTPENTNGIQQLNTFVADTWVYDAIPNVAEAAQATYQLGQRESPLEIGLRDHSMRTPIQFQQNFPRETAISEAAALAGIDPIQFRLAHLKEPRFAAILTRLRQEAGWETRPSPSPRASATGSDPVRGQGVSIMLREGGYWACAANIAVTPDTGMVKVERITLVMDLGIVVNPLQLRRQVQAGCLMGVSQAIHEEVAFDEGKITASDWSSYPILTMAEMPELKIVIAANPTAGKYGQGSESANALAAPAIAAAFFDATGKPARRIPLRPAYVKEMLQA